MAEKIGGTDPREFLMRQNLFQKRQTNSPVEYLLIVSAIGRGEARDRDK